MKNKKSFIIMGLSLLIILFTINIPSKAYASDSYYRDNYLYLENQLYYRMKNIETEFKFVYDGDMDSAFNIIENAAKHDGYTNLNVEQCYLEQYGDRFTAKISYKVSKTQDEYITNVLTDVINSKAIRELNSYDKVKFVNEYLIKSFQYDDDLKSFDSYTAITTGKTVCQGYAMTAAKMYDLLGIENEVVIGTLNGVGHGWNKVKIGGNWYNIDTTNCDALEDSEILFLKSDKYLRDNGFSFESDQYTDSYYNYEEISHKNDTEKPYGQLKLNSSSSNKWYLKNGGWYYKDLAGEDTIGWVYDSNHWYYLGDDGKMKNGWVDYSGYSYYFNSRGEMQTGQQCINGRWYYFNDIGQRIY